MPGIAAMEAVWRSETDRKIGEHGARLDGHDKKLEKTVTLDAFTPVQKIVYSATGLILTAAIAAVAQIFRVGHFPW